MVTSQGFPWSLSASAPETWLVQLVTNPGAWEGTLCTTFCVLTQWRAEGQTAHHTPDVRGRSAAHCFWRSHTGRMYSASTLGPRWHTPP